MNGTTALRRSVGGVGAGSQEPPPVATLVVYQDDGGYGMKVSGDNPVYVQSVKEGGAAARAGLNAGDKIIKVNGVNVMQSTHVDVVELIKSSTQVVLTVQQKPASSSTGLQLGSLTGLQQQRPASLSAGSTMVSPTQPASSLHRASTAPAGGAPPTCNARITGPRPVDVSHEKTEASVILRPVCKIASAAIACTLSADGAFRIDTSHASSSSTLRALTNSAPPFFFTHRRTPASPRLAIFTATTRDHEKKRQMDAQRVHTFQLMLEKEQSYVDKLRSDLAKSGAGAGSTSSMNALHGELAGAERRLRTLQDQLAAITTSDQLSQGVNFGSSGSLNKHQRTKSSPEQLSATMISPSEASKRLIASESLNDLSPPRHSGIDLDDPVHVTPPGTPPPPYPQPSPASETSSSAINDSLGDSFVTISPVRQPLNESIPGLPPIQKPIMSMEDDDMSDQEVGQLGDHGPFKSLSRLWEHHAHLSVFINYVLSNSDPSSLLFYLVTDLYKDGNAKEMRKWAYEIHSSFLVPGAPLRLSNVDENVAREIDEVLLKEYDKEEILRQIFRKARARAREELNEQLADFQQKRTAGLGTLFGPKEEQLDECVNDKMHEARIMETYILPKMQPYLEALEADQVDLRKFTTAAGLATILTKTFQVRPMPLEQVPTFVAKDKSNIKARLTGKTRKMNVQGHHFVAHQYYTVTFCNLCQLIIGGIGPQGYQCSDCSHSVHRACVRAVEETCPGPFIRKERANDRISRIMERIRPERKPPSSHRADHSQNYMHQIERVKRGEEEAGVIADGENGEHRGGGASGNARSSCERGRISAYGDYPDSMDNNPSSREDISEMVQQNISSKPKTSNINRSESYKERIHHRRQLREKRKTSDPNLSKTNDCEAAGTFPGNSAGSSSNSSLSTRSLDSPSTSLEQVHPANAGANTSTSWDSDVDVEADPPEWSQGVSEEVLSRLSNSEKKRQEVINELFHTERSHVRALKVLSHVFHKPLLDSQVLPLDQVQLLFSNLDEMVTIHSRFNQAMKRKKKENPCVGEVGDLLLEMFDGEAGEEFERAASTYCAKQQVALDALRDRRRKDPKLNSFLNEVEANPLCRRLQLKDHILTGMLRLTKYPLLFENLAKYTARSDEKEKAAVLRALERSKEILSIVNQAVREADDYQRLAEIQRTIDRSAFDKFDHPTVQEFKNIDITKRKLLFEGPLQWRIVNRPKPVDLHVVLLDDTIFLLHRQDDKYLLKFINTNQVNSVLSPIVRVSTVLVRNNAVDKNSLYLVNTSQNGAQIYDLVAASQAERELWCKHISEAAEPYCKARDREGRRPTPPTVMTEETTTTTTAAPVASHANVSGAAATVVTENPPEQPTDTDANASQKTEEPAPEETNEGTKDNGDDASGKTEEAGKQEDDREIEATKPETTKHDEESSQLHARHSPIPGSGEPMRMVTCTQCNLIDPIEVHTELQPVHVAEPVLTPIECLRRKDEVIKRALVEKQSLVADILNIPKEDFEHVADMASEATGLEKEPAELILAAISQANHLVGLLNSALTVSETESVLASKGAAAAVVPTTAGCEATGCPIPRNHNHPYQPVIPVVALQPVCHSLTSQLSQLLEIVKEREEERERLRKELRRSRERLHAHDADAQRREQPSISTAEIYTQTESEGNLSTEIATDSTNVNEFADACGEAEQDANESHDAKGSIDGKAMGDSVG